MTEESKGIPLKPLLSITGASKNEEGQIVLEFDLSDEFVEIFKRDHGLSRWSQKKFDKWASENIETLIAASGIGPQLEELSQEGQQEEE
jgi:hypothetical protein